MHIDIDGGNQKLVDGEMPARVEIFSIPTGLTISIQISTLFDDDQPCRTISRGIDRGNLSRFL